jgi:hypothetical protein
MSFGKESNSASTTSFRTSTAHCATRFLIAFLLYKSQPLPSGDADDNANADRYKPLNAALYTLQPQAVRLDPFCPGRRRLRQRQIEDQNRLTLAAAAANRDNLFGSSKIDPLDSDGYTQQLSIERARRGVPLS